MDLRIFSEPHQGASYDDLVALAVLAEEAGFDAFFRSDHFMKMGSVSGLPGPTDAWITLAGLARETTRFRLGTLLTAATFRLPGPLAVAAAQVDLMSGGRLEVGLGAGWYEPEHRAYGIPFPPLAERFTRLEEQFDILRGLWTTPLGQEFSYRGQYYSLENSPALPKPFQQPHPPLIVGGRGPSRTPALAARVANEFNVPFSPPDVCAAQYQRLDDACQNLGRHPGDIVRSAAVVLCCGQSEGELDERARTLGGVPEDHGHWLYGTPTQLVEQIHRYEEVGVTRLYLQITAPRDLDHVRLVADHVLPRLSPS